MPKINPDSLPEPRVEDDSERGRKRLLEEILAEIARERAKLRPSPGSGEAGLPLD